MQQTAPCVDTMEHASDLCDQLGDGVGVALDVYHLWWDYKLQEQITRAGTCSRIFAFHICDGLVPTTDILLDPGMMGDGIIDIPSIRSLAEESGYKGLYEVEILSKTTGGKKIRMKY